MLLPDFSWWIKIFITGLLKDFFHGYSHRISSPEALYEPKCLAPENWSHWAIVWRCLRDSTFSHFGTVPACDGRTDGRTDRHMMTIYTLYRASIASRGKKTTVPATAVGLGEENPTPVVSLLPPGLPPRTVAWTVSSELLCFWFYFSLFCRFWAVR